ncbi:hypothetical protein SLI_0081 [Streptomyces lividans 1326]|uniref:Uncharacterized protein n=1 Tax=Streptomyces lividans 1326 TaxID=1200984 RepID=A0A7U9H843_STRLI|nr:hypothetical protein SLI_0081 [Streptomyces lividans 1326]
MHRRRCARPDRGLLGVWCVVCGVWCVVPGGQGSPFGTEGSAGYAR